MPSDRTVVEIPITSDLLVAVGKGGARRASVFPSDCSPNWAPSEFWEDWERHTALFHAPPGWAVGQDHAQATPG